MLQFAVDTGGTFTDLVVDGNGLQPRFYKRSTTPADPIEGLLAVFAAAAADHGDDLPTFIGRGDSLVFGTTRATNAVVTGSTARTALLCTEGHPDVLLFREGGGRTTLFDYTQEYPAPYIPRSLTFEIPERILADGSVHTDAPRKHRPRGGRTTARARGGGDRGLPSLVDPESGSRAPGRRAPCARSSGDPGHALSRPEPESARVPTRIVCGYRRIAQAIDEHASFGSWRRPWRSTASAVGC